MIESSPPSIPGVISLLPTFPSNGAMMVSVVNSAIFCPFFTDGYLSKLIDLISSLFLILIE